MSFQGLMGVFGILRWFIPPSGSSSRAGARILCWELVWVSCLHSDQLPTGVNYEFHLFFSSTGTSNTEVAGSFELRVWDGIRWLPAEGRYCTFVSIIWVALAGIWDTVHLPLNLCAVITLGAISSVWNFMKWTICLHFKFDYSFTRISLSKVITARHQHPVRASS